jgi:hypothetical protein
LATIDNFGRYPNWFRLEDGAQEFEEILKMERLDPNTAAHFGLFRKI